MGGKILYEYAVIRLVPKVEREEFLNVGVIVFSKARKYLRMKYWLDEKKLALFSDDLDIECVERNIKAMAMICAGEIEGGEIGRLDIPERFRWVTAVRSTIIQTSRPHPGLTDDLDCTLLRLYEDLVL